MNDIQKWLEVSTLQGEIARCKRNISAGLLVLLIGILVSAGLSIWFGLFLAAVGGLTAIGNVVKREGLEEKLAELVK